MKNMINTLIVITTLIGSGFTTPAHAWFWEGVTNAKTKVSSIKATAVAVTVAEQACAVVNVNKQICSSISDIKDVAVVGVTAAAVTGSSGASIMGTLGGLGSAVSTGLSYIGIGVGSTVAGVATVGGAAGLATASLANKYVFNGDTKSDIAARTATYTGAVAGTAGGIAVISSAGSVAGLSGAGITSGLAAIGSTVGGGMAAGATMVVAAPVVAAVGLAATTYWLFSEPPPKPKEKAGEGYLAGD